jgi:hypothetical protein
MRDKAAEAPNAGCYWGAVRFFENGVAMYVMLK